jgi:septum formation topological specificity factor MinE
MSIMMVWIMGKKKSKTAAHQRFEQIVKTDKALSQIQDLDLLLEEILFTARKHRQRRGRVDLHREK